MKYTAFWGRSELKAKSWEGALRAGMTPEWGSPEVCPLGPESYLKG
jgi:hypothetical protein